MTLTFAETHNMIAYLTKSDASEGFNQIIDFLNGSSIKYALTANPNIYVSCVKQFWTFVTVKKVNDVTRLQALVDKKKVMIMEASIRDALRLDDAEGVEYFPNEEIFAEKQVGDLSSHSTKYTSLALTQKVFTNMRRVGKGFFGVETPLFEGMIVEQQIAEGADEVHDEGVHVVGIVTERDVSAANDKVPTAIEEPSIPFSTPPTPPPQPSQDIPSTSQVQLTPPHSPQVAQALEITKLKSRVKKLERRNKASKLRRLKRVGSAQRINTSHDTVIDDVSKQGGIIVNIDAYEDVVLEVSKDVAVEKSADVKDNANIQGRKAESQAKIYKIDLEHDKKVLNIQEEESEPAKIQEVVDVVTTAKIITEVVTAASTTITAADVPVPAATTATALTLTVAPSRRTEGVVIRDPEESATPSTIIHSEAKSKDKGNEILGEEPKPLKKQAQIEQDEKYARELEAELNRNIDWDELIDHVQRKQKEDTYVKRYQALKRKPQTKAQARKNMMIYLKNVAGIMMDYFKRMNYDDICLIFEKYFDSNVAFLQKTKEQMDEEDSKALKRLNEKRRYPLIRFTLNQMFNNVRLEVEDESKVSVEFLSFGVDAAMDFKEKLAKCLMLLVKELVLPSQDDAVD
nr:hypothetical protein [Tanacetum cinerariifolium]